MRDNIKKYFKLTIASEQESEDKPTPEKRLRKAMEAMLAYIRAIHTWFHGAHHITSGTGFAGDHVSLYGRIYEEIQEDFDEAAEKAIGLLDEQVACPIVTLRNAARVSSNFKSPVGLDDLEIANEALSIIDRYLQFLNKIYYDLKDSDELTLGLDDFIMAMANDYETFLYLLRQRVTSAK